MKQSYRPWSLLKKLLLSLLSFTLSLTASEEQKLPELKASPQKMQKWVEELCAIRPPREVDHPESLNKSISLIRRAFSEHGLTSTLQDVPFRDHTYYNVVSSLKGDSKRGLVVIGAHYDVCGNTPGADDNASGVAGLLELTRLFSKVDSRRLPPMELVAYSLEEPPVFRSPYMGSAVHARKLKKENRRVDHMICLESIGYFTDKKNSQRYPLAPMSLLYPSEGNFIAVVGNFSSRSVNQRITSFIKGTGIPTESLTAPGMITGVDFSDHRNYWAEGYKAVMITDTALFRNPHYHQMSDLPHTLDYFRMSQIVDGVFSYLLSLSNKE